MRYLDLSSEIVSRNSRFLTPSLALARLLSFVLSFVSRWQGRGARALWVMCHLRLLRNVMEIFTAKRNGNSICKEYTPFVPRTTIGMSHSEEASRGHSSMGTVRLLRNGMGNIHSNVPLVTRRHAFTPQYVKNTTCTASVCKEYTPFAPSTCISST